MKARKQIVFNATQFVTTAAKVSTVKVAEITPGQIVKRNATLNTMNIFKSAQPVKAISKMHHIKILEHKPICSILSKNSDAVTKQTYEVGVLPSFSSNLPTVASSTVPADIKLGSWVEVSYEGNVFSRNCERH